MWLLSFASAQFQEFDWPAFAWAALITIVMGGLVEAAQSVTGKVSM